MIVCLATFLSSPRIVGSSLGVGSSPAASSLRSASSLSPAWRFSPFALGFHRLCRSSLPALWPAYAFTGWPVRAVALGGHKLDRAGTGWPLTQTVLIRSVGTAPPVVSITSRAGPRASAAETRNGAANQWGRSSDTPASVPCSVSGMMGVQPAGGDGDSTRLPERPEALAQMGTVPFASVSASWAAIVAPIPHPGKPLGGRHSRPPPVAWASAPAARKGSRTVEVAPHQQIVACVPGTQDETDPAAGDPFSVDVEHALDSRRWLARSGSRSSGCRPADARWPCTRASPSAVAAAAALPGSAAIVRPLQTCRVFRPQGS